MLETIERQRLSDVVAAKIRQLILRGHLKPGDRLPTEHELAERFGVSRVSVREATKALGFLGVLEAAPRRGLTVGRVDLGRVDLGRVTEYLGLHPAVSDASSEQLIDTRVVIETGVLPHVARRMAEDPSIHEGLRALNERLRGTRDLVAWIELDIAFHRRLVESSGLAPLAAFNDILQAFFQRFRESVKKAEWRAGIESHGRIIVLLRDGKVSAASAELRRHIESHKARMVEEV
ncbi:MAG: FadR family transcriptional regulator [Planctomycetes bacterium]|nr:FadR family transcriptional regulator [Planctomycetota bacterium]